VREQRSFQPQNHAANDAQTNKGKQKMNAIALLVLATLTAGSPDSSKKFFISLDGKTVTTVKVKAKNLADPLATNLILMLEAIESGDKEIVETVFCGESKAALSCAEDKSHLVKKKLGKMSLVRANQIVQAYGKSLAKCWDGTRSDKEIAKSSFRELSKKLGSLGNGACDQARIKWVDLKDATKL
jgi:hypothetical protein